MTDDPLGVAPYSLPLAEPLETARGTMETREGFVVRVRSGGIGEAAPLSAFTESPAACEEALETARTVAAEEGIEAANDALDSDATPAAVHGVAGATLDAAAKAVDEPLYRLLGGEARERLPVNAVVGDGQPEETASAAGEAVGNGFDCVKVKIGARSPAEDAERLRAVRNAVGKQVTLRADANGAWSRPEAERALEALAPLDLQYVEQPLAPADLAGLAALRGSDVPIAIDEGLTVHDVSAVLEAGAADALIVKPMAHGSPTAARAIATAGLEAGLTVTVTTTIDAVVARTAAVQVAASLPDVAACGLATADRLASDLGPDPAPVEDGRIQVPQAPGLGVEEVSR